MTQNLCKIAVQIFSFFPGGFYALLAAHLASLAMNWDADTLVFRQRMRKGKPAKAIQVLISTTSFAYGNFWKKLDCD